MWTSYLCLSCIVFQTNNNNICLILKLLYIVKHLAYSKYADISDPHYQAAQITKKTAQLELELCCCLDSNISSVVVEMLINTLTDIFNSEQKGLRLGPPGPFLRRAFIQKQKVHIFCYICLTCY